MVQMLIKMGWVVLLFLILSHESGYFVLLYGEIGIYV